MIYGYSNGMNSTIHSTNRQMIVDHFDAWIKEFQETGGIRNLELLENDRDVTPVHYNGCVFPGGKQPKMIRKVVANLLLSDTPTRGTSTWSEFKVLFAVWEVSELGEEA